MIELNKDKILELLRNNREHLLKFGVNKIGLFGSFVRGENEKQSDIDFLVEFESDMKTYNNFIELVFFLESIFNREIELLTPESLSPYLKSHILEEVEFELIKES